MKDRIEDEGTSYWRTFGLFFDSKNSIFLTFLFFFFRFHLKLGRYCLFLTMFLYYIDLHNLFFIFFNTLSEMSFENKPHKRTLVTVALEQHWTICSPLICSSSGEIRKQKRCGQNRSTVHSCCESEIFMIFTYRAAYHKLTLQNRVSPECLVWHVQRQFTNTQGGSLWQKERDKLSFSLKQFLKASLNNKTSKSHCVQHLLCNSWHKPGMKMCALNSFLQDHAEIGEMRTTTSMQIDFVYLEPPLSVFMFP